MRGVLRMDATALLMRFGSDPIRGSNPRSSAPDQALRESGEVPVLVFWGRKPEKPAHCPHGDAQPALLRGRRGTIAAAAFTAPRDVSGKMFTYTCAVKVTFA